MGVSPRNALVPIHTQEFAMKMWHVAAAAVMMLAGFNTIGTAEEPTKVYVVET